MTLWKTISTELLRYRSLILVFIVVMMGLGLVAWERLEKQGFPELAHPALQLSIRMDGASAEEIEQRVTRPVEQLLLNMGEFRSVRSYSVEDYSYIHLSLKKAHRVDRLKARLLKAIEEAGILPEKNSHISFSHYRSPQLPVFTVMLGGAESYQLLRYEAQLLKQAIDQVEGVAMIHSEGYLSPEIHVLVNPDLLHYYLISLDDIRRHIQEKAQHQTAGRLAFQNQTQQLRTGHPITSLEDLETLAITAKKTFPYVRLKQLAWVEHGYERRQTLFRRNGLETIRFTIHKDPQADPVKLLQRLTAVVEQHREDLQLKTITISYDASISTESRSAFTVFQQNILLIVAAFTLFVMAFLHRRSALVVAGLVPFTLLSTFCGMALFAIPFNLVSISIILLALGILIPTSVEMAVQIIRQLEDGATVKQACIEGVSQHAAAGFTLSMTVILALASGMIIDAAVFWPITLIATMVLGSSFLYSSLLMPALISVFLKKPRNTKKVLLLHNTLLKLHHFLYQRLYGLFKARYRFLILSSLLLLVSLFVFITQLAHLDVAPASSADRFTIFLEAPSNVSLEQNATALRKVEKHVANLPNSELRFFTSTVGQQDRGHELKQGRHYAQLSVYLSPSETRHRDIRQIMSVLHKKIREDLSFYKHLEILPSLEGVRGIDPVRIQLLGDDYQRLDELAQQLRFKLKTLTYVERVQSRFQDPIPELRIEPMDHLMATYKVPLSAIDRNVHTAMTGEIISTVTLDGEALPVRLVLHERYREQSNYLRDLLIPNTTGLLYKLLYLAQFKNDMSYPIRPHVEGRRAIELQVNLPPGLGLTRNRLQDMATLIHDVSPRDDSVDIVMIAPESMMRLTRPAFWIAVGLAVLLIGLSLRQFFGRSKEIVLLSLSLLFVLSSSCLIGVLFRDGLSLGWALGGLGTSLLFMTQGVYYLADVRRGLLSKLQIVKALFEAFTGQFRSLFISTLVLMIGFLPIAYLLGQDNAILSDFAFMMGWGALISAISTLFILPCLMLVSEEMAQKKRLEIKAK